MRPRLLPLGLGHLLDALLRALPAATALHCVAAARLQVLPQRLLADCLLTDLRVHPLLLYCIILGCRLDGLCGQHLLDGLIFLKGRFGAYALRDRLILAYFQVVVIVHRNLLRIQLI